MRAFLALFALVFVFFMMAKPDPKSQTSSSANAVALAETRQSNAERRRIEHMNQLQNVELAKFSWQKGGFDNVMLGTFTLKNSNDFTVKDIVVTCDHTANSGTLIDSNTRTIYEAIKAKGRKTIRKFNMGLINTQVARSSCRVVDFVAG